MQVLMASFSGTVYSLIQQLPKQRTVKHDVLGFQSVFYICVIREIRGQIIYSHTVRSIQANIRHHGIMVAGTLLNNSRS